MAFLKVSKNYSNILVKFLNTPLSTAVSGLKKLDLYLKDAELFVKTLSGYPAFVTGDSSPSNCHKLPEVSE